MTVTSTQRSVTYTGNGSTTEFPIEFYFEVDWIVATFSTVNDSGEVLSEDVVDPGEYTLSGAGEESGGSLTYPLSGEPLSASERLTIERVVPVTQERVFSNTKPYDATQHGAALDKLTMVAQRHDDDLGRCVKVPVGEDTDPDDFYAALRQDAANAATAMSAAQAAQDEAEDARDAAQAAAAGLGLPALAEGDADKVLQVKGDESGYELQTVADILPAAGEGTAGVQENATDADMLAGTATDKTATPANHAACHKHKVEYFSRDLSATSSGTQDITIGFKPRKITAVYHLVNSAYTSGGRGDWNDTPEQRCTGIYETSGQLTPSANSIVLAGNDGSNLQYASVTSVSDTNLRLTWAKAGSPVGTVYVTLILER